MARNSGDSTAGFAPSTNADSNQRSSVFIRAGAGAGAAGHRRGAESPRNIRSSRARPGCRGSRSTRGRRWSSSASATCSSASCNSTSCRSGARRSTACRTSPCSSRTSGCRGPFHSSKARSGLRPIQRRTRSWAGPVARAGTQVGPAGIPRESGQTRPGNGSDWISSFGWRHPQRYF